MFRNTDIRKEIGFFSLIFVVICICMFMVIPVNAVSLTEYTDLSVNNTAHIQTEIDLSESNFTVLFDNQPINYKPNHDVIITGLEYDTEYSILLISPYGQVQEIQITTDKQEKQPFYYEYGVFGLFVLCLIMLVIGTYIPLVNLMAVLFGLLGFIMSLKTEHSTLTAMMFVILFAIAGIMFGIRYNKI